MADCWFRSLLVRNRQVAYNSAPKWPSAKKVGARPDYVIGFEYRLIYLGGHGWITEVFGRRKEFERGVPHIAFNRGVVADVTLLGDWKTRS